MNHTELKEKIARDMERLPTLEVRILEKHELYPEVKHILKQSYQRFLYSFFIWVIPALLFHGEIFSVFRLTGSFIAVAILGVILHAFALPTVSQYIILKKTVFPQLEMGDFILQKINDWIKGVGKFVWVIFLVWTFIFWVFGVDVEHSYTDPMKFVGVYIIFMLLPTAFFAAIYIRTEVNRLGVSAFFTLLQAVMKRSSSGSKSEQESVISSASDDNRYNVTHPNHPMNPANPASPLYHSSTDRY